MEFPPPKDMPTDLYQKSQDTKVYVNHPPRIFHLKPQFVRFTPSDDWEKTFLHQKVSVPRMKVEYLEPLRFPGLDCRSFPGELYEVCRVLQRHYNPITQGEEFITWAKHVLNYEEKEADLRRRTAIRYGTPPSGGLGPRDDLRMQAIGIIKHYADGGWEEAVEIHEQLAERDHILAEMTTLVRFRDHNGVPNGLGYRPSQDTLYLDNQFLEDYLEGLSQDASPFNKPLVPFLNGNDCVKIRHLAVSVAPFTNTNIVSTLCHAVLQTFPNVMHLKLVTLAVVDRRPHEWWEADTQFAKFQTLESIVEREFYMGVMRQRAGGPAPQTPVAAYAIATGLMLDPNGPATHHRSPPRPAAPPASLEDAFVGPGPALGARGGPAPAAAAAAEPAPRDWPPLLHTVHQEMKKARRAVVASTIMQTGSARRARRIERDGSPTRLPRPDAERRAVTGASPRALRARFERERNERLGSVRELGPEKIGGFDPDRPLAHPDHAPLAVEPVVLCYYRDAFDRATRRGWSRYGPMIDLSHLDMSV